MSIVYSTAIVLPIDQLSDDELFELTESVAQDVIHDIATLGAITIAIDPETQSGHLDRSYYQAPAWMTYELVDDPFAF